MPHPLMVKTVSSSDDRQTCYRLRHEVFVEEQGVPAALELDDRDETDAMHFLGTVDEVPVAASRICVNGDVAKLQRIVVSKEHRGRGFGRDMVLAMIDTSTSSDQLWT